jgi:hypothetical protein
MYEFLKKLFGETKEGEEPKTMTYEDLEKAIDAAKIKPVNLAEGGYVDEEKFKAKDKELAGIKAQLKEANDQIAGFQKDGKTIEDIKKEAENWKTKYETDTAKMTAEMEAQKKSFAADKLLNDYKFSSKLARKGILDEFMKADPKLDDSGNFIGATDIMSKLQKDYEDAFLKEEEHKDDDKEEHQETPPPTNPYQQAAGFVPPTWTNPGKKQGAAGKTMTLDEAMAKKNANPVAKIDYSSIQ